MNLGIPSSEASLLVGYLSISSTVSRFVFGIVLYHPKINRFYVLQVRTNFFRPPHYGICDSFVFRSLSLIIYFFRCHFGIGCNKSPTLLAEPFFCLLDLAFSRKALHESSKIFIEYALHVARIQSRTQA